MIKLTCAWCGKPLGVMPGGDGESHGICPECYEKEIEKIKGARNNGK